MKKHNSIFYLLFILVVMGTFASMAQNSYGLKIMGGAAFVFGLVFLVDFVTGLWKYNEGKNMYALIESGCLFVLAVLFGFRVFYIYFPFIELLFGTAAIVLAVVYLAEMLTRFRHFQRKNRTLALLVIVYHSSIILFLCSLAFISFAPRIGQVTGLVALVLLVVFLAAGFFRKNLMVDGEDVSAFKMVRRFRGYSVIVISLFLLFSLYVGLNRVGVLPGIYSDELPRAYMKLVDQTSSRTEIGSDGKKKYEEFMENYQQFLRHREMKR